VDGAVGGCRACPCRQAAPLLGRVGRFDRRPWVEEPAHGGAVEALLVDRLVGADVAQSGGRSAVSTINGVPECACPGGMESPQPADVDRRTTGLPVCLARPTPKNEPLRSSMCINTRIFGWRWRAIAIGAEREPGETQANSTPCAASSSTKVAAKDCVTSIGSVCDSVWKARPVNHEVIGDGTPVTLLRWLTQSVRSWHEVIAGRPAGYQWVVPDLRGHGDTRVRPGAPHTMEACTADLEMLWDHLGISRTHLVGYSMGGRLALHVAATRPQRILSLLTIGAHAGLEEDARAARRRGARSAQRRMAPRHCHY
jgi:hypothetical protein